MNGNVIRTVTKIEANPLLKEKRNEFRKMRVAAYCRVSTDEDDQLNSLQTQMQYYTAKISENPEWTMADIYADEGITGTRTDKRKNFLRLMRDCEKGKIDYILTKSTARFARNTVDSLSWVRKLRAKGVGVYFEEQNIDSLKAENETFIGLYSVLAQSESESISENVKWGIHKRMKNGTYSVRFNMLGYRNGDDGNPIIVPEEAEIVRNLFNRFLDGDSILGLKRYLEDNGVKTPSGKSEWSRSYIQSLLSNEKYVGDVIFQKTYRTDCISKKVKKNNGELTRYMITNNHAPIVDRDTFNMVQAEIARRNSKRKKSDFTLTEQGKYSSKFVLSDILVCGCCGGAMKRTVKTSNGKKIYHWRCINRIDHGKDFCKESVGIEESKLQSAICRCISKMMEYKEEVIELIRHNLTYAISGEQTELDLFALETQLNELKEQSKELMDMALKTGGNSERYQAEIKKIFEQTAAIRSQIEYTKAKSSTDEKVTSEVRRIMDIIQNTDISFNEYDDITIRRLVDCIQANKGTEISVTLKGGFQRREVI
ncbi:MAG: recombinase family protein [Synergistaceae bacterium]|nr:recombinase family protein [Synergistaceae bacterium]